MVERLSSMGSTNNFCISSTTIKIKVIEHSSPLTITHLDGFNIHFPDINLSPPTDPSYFKIYNKLCSCYICYFYYLSILFVCFFIFTGTRIIQSSSCFQFGAIFSRIDYY